MKQFVTRGIILHRTDYGEADRIITLLTPDYGKLRLMAKGVRRVKSKLAGGIELFSVSHITFIQGRGDVGTLISTRLEKHYGNIVTDIERVQLGYDLIKLLNKATEDETEEAYFHLLQQALAALNDETISIELVRLWFYAQLLRLSGHAPNLQTDVLGAVLAANSRYNFSFDDMAFAAHPSGKYSAHHIKLLRLAAGHHGPKMLSQVQGSEELLPAVLQLTSLVYKYSIS